MKKNCKKDYSLVGGGVKTSEGSEKKIKENDNNDLMIRKSGLLLYKVYRPLRHIKKTKHFRHKEKDR